MLGNEKELKRLAAIETRRGDEIAARPVIELPEGWRGWSKSQQQEYLLGLALDLKAKLLLIEPDQDDRQQMAVLRDAADSTINQSIKIGELQMKSSQRDQLEELLVEARKIAAKR
jgi:hypothetical protein